MLLEQDEALDQTAMAAGESEKCPTAGMDAELVSPDYIRTNTNTTLVVYNSCNNHGREE
jgi:hypothetical protein